MHEQLITPATRQFIKTGYRHPSYADSLSEFGQPYHLPRCDGWLLRRQIPGTNHYDAMGCYPMFFCEDLAAIAADLEEVGSELVSLILVIDPFAGVDQEPLNHCFDRVIPFKDHFVAELDRPLEQIVKKSHRNAVRRALKHVHVTVCPRPIDNLEAWVELYATLGKRHNIRGIRAFSLKAFREQLLIPGIVMFEAWHGEELVGLDLWYVQRDVAYGHLVAFSDKGYELRASYATKWHALLYFQDKVRWIDFGGGAGSPQGGKTDGLTAFKMGWATETLPVYLCTRTFQPEVYQALRSARQVGETPYFPAYRQGEFA